MLYEMVFTERPIKTSTVVKLDGLVNPKLYNEGTSLVTIGSLKIYPGESYEAGSPVAVNSGNISVQFDKTPPGPGEPDKVHLVVMVYGIPKGPYYNPVNGYPYSTKEKSLMAQGQEC